MKKNSSLYLALFLIALATIGRLLPHPANFTPVLGLLVFTSAHMKQQRFLGPIFLLASMLISDFFIGFHSGIFYIYPILALCFLLSRSLSNKKSLFSIAGASFACSGLFFVLSNFGVWAFSGLYPLSLGGLWQCYLMAVPFFHNSLASCLLWSVGLSLALKSLEMARDRLVFAQQS